MRMKHDTSYHNTRMNLQCFYFHVGCNNFSGAKSEFTYYYTFVMIVALLI